MQRVCLTPAPRALPPQGRVLIGALLEVRVAPASHQPTCAPMALCLPPPIAPPSLHTLRVPLVQEVRATGALPTHFATSPARLHHALLFLVLEIVLEMPMCALLESTIQTVEALLAHAPLVGQGVILFQGPLAARAVHPENMLQRGPPAVQIVQLAGTHPMDPPHAAHALRDTTPQNQGPQCVPNAPLALTPPSVAPLIALAAPPGTPPPSLAPHLAPSAILPLPLHAPPVCLPWELCLTGALAAVHQGHASLAPAFAPMVWCLPPPLAPPTLLTRRAPPAQEGQATGAPQIPSATPPAQIQPVLYQP